MFSLMFRTLDFSHMWNLDVYDMKTAGRLVRKRKEISGREMGSEYGQSTWHICTKIPEGNCYFV